MNAESPTPPGDVGDREAHSRDLIVFVRDFARDLNIHMAGAIEVTPQSRLDRDLAIDSLGRTQLIRRLEPFGGRLPTATIARAGTVEDPMAALAGTSPHRRMPHAMPDRPESLPELRIRMVWPSPRAQCLDHELVVRRVDEPGVGYSCGRKYCE
jgi:acyl carrier protein